jgi:transposase InsO family protein
MGSVLHAQAKTTERVRKEIQASRESIAKLARRYSINPKTVMKWKHAGRVTDKKCGPTHPRSTVLTEVEEQIICEFRRQTKLPLDDVFISLRDTIKTLTRSSLHRCLKRHGLNRLPQETQPKRVKQKFSDYPLGYVHVDITEIRLQKKKYYLFVGIERKCKYVYAELHDRMTQKNAVTFLEHLVDHVPFKIHRLLTDNGSQFTYQLLAEHLRPKNKIHPFLAFCQKRHIQHKLIRFHHPWTNGQVEVFNRVAKEHTTKIFHYDSVLQLRHHLTAFILYYNCSRPLRALNYRSPFDTLLQFYRSDPSRFQRDPSLFPPQLSSHNTTLNPIQPPNQTPLPPLSFSTPCHIISGPNK